MNEQQQKITPQQYVCGFMFSDDFKWVAMVTKNKPAWQAGKLNGIGGKIEQTGHRPDDQHTELPHEAMAREFEEETGVATNPQDWTLFRSERFANGTGATVHFLWAKDSNKLRHVRTVESEPIDIFSVSGLLDVGRERMMYNIPYLLEMAIALAQQPKENVPVP